VGLAEKSVDWLRTEIPWKIVIGIIIAAAAVIGPIFVTMMWIQKSARDAVLDETLLRTLTERVRPMCIFNSKNTVEVNQGADLYIDLEHIKVKPAPEAFGFKITLHGKRHLVNAPLVSVVDVNLFPEKIERGKGFDWTVLLIPRSTFTGIRDEAAMDTTKVYRFKVEIVH
jgi:hypothetical protein